MNLKIYVSATFILISLLLASVSFAHCQIPCGIYDDATQFKVMYEDVETIRKSDSQIVSLSNEKDKNYNQIVRWVMNKEEHADKIAHITTYYFMAQRIKPVTDSNAPEYPEYIKRITLLHRILVTAMKTKQTTDTKTVDELFDLITEFEKSYFHK